MLVVVGALVVAAAWPVRASASGPFVRVIVQAGGWLQAREAVRDVGGRVTLGLPLIGGVAAEVPADALPALAGSEGVLSVSEDERIAFDGAAAETKACKDYTKRKKRKRCRELKKLEGTLVQRVVRADRLWSEGVTGKGVTVAILDTGVYEHPDLAGRVLHCEDFSNEFAQGVLPTPEPTDLPTDLPTVLPTDLPTVLPTDLPTAVPTDLPTAVPTDLPTGLPTTLPTTLPSVLPTSLPTLLPRTESEPPIGEHGCTDTFGHGTFMAGLAVGAGTTSKGRFSGAAPEANLVAIKAAGFDGSTDVSKILAGIQWAVAYKDEYDIRVLNLSLGTDSDQDYRSSPLNYAVERAWDAGIVVVVSAGNSGPDESTVMKPGDDPLVITVGSSNDEGTLDFTDDRVPVFSSRGNTRSNDLEKPDILAPGVHTISLRSPGSAIDQQFPDARVRDAYFRGTGTSMSTATVSGVVALMLQADPSLTPDQVKYRLMHSARPIVDTDPKATGSGLADAYSATRRPLDGEANQGVERSNGLGSIALDRGTVDIDVVIPGPVVQQVGLTADAGELVAMTPSSVDPNNPLALVPWLGTEFVSTGWDPASWDASTWKTEQWAASTWKASTWKGTGWEASTWKGTEWTNIDWDASTWKNVDWDASTWKASTWKSRWYGTAWD